MSEGRAERMLRPLGLDGFARSNLYRVSRDPWWTLNNRATASRSSLLKLKNAQAGACGVIVGTGPSLRQTDLSAIGDRPTIGLNRLYQGCDALGFRPDLLVCVNLLMLAQSADEIEASGLPVVASWAGRQHFSADADVTFIRTFDGTSFSRDLTDRVYTGSTVTYVALQLAHWLGWKHVTLLGIDHTYRLERHEAAMNPHDTSVRTAPDENHFLPGYFPAGQSWQLPDLENSEMAYAEARKAFEADGRKVVDATVGGALDVFEKCSWQSVDHSPRLGTGSN